MIDDKFVLAPVFAVTVENFVLRSVFALMPVVAVIKATVLVGFPAGFGVGAVSQVAP